MEKLEGAGNKERWFGEGEIVDADLLVDLLDTYRFGKSYVSARDIGSKAAVTTEMENEEDDNGSHGHGNKSVPERTSSVSSNSDPILLDTIRSETGSNEEPNSNEETGYNWLESNLPDVENETQQNAEDGDIKEEEEEEEEEGVESERLSSASAEEEGVESERSTSESNFEELLATQEKYELYCPSCSSCITRKVILKETKRGKHIYLNLNVPVDEPEESSDNEEMEPPVNVHVTDEEEEEEIESDDDKEDKDKGDIFTCLACLKYFIRLGARLLQLDYIRGKTVDDEHIIVDLEERTTESPTDRKRFAVELLKSTVYGGLTETITSLGVVFSASASGSSTLNILALAVANLAGGLVVLAQNVQDLRNSCDQYEELLGRRANFRVHILVALLSYILFGLIPPLVYAFSFYETGVKKNKLISVFSVSLVCIILLGMIKVYARKPPNVRESFKSYLKSAAYYTSIVVASSGISYVVGDVVGEYIGKLGWFSLDQVGMTSPFDGTKLSEYLFTSF